jgi:hypothetical protein
MIIVWFGSVEVKQKQIYCILKAPSCNKRFIFEEIFLLLIGPEMGQKSLLEGKTT